MQMRVVGRGRNSNGMAVLADVLNIMEEVFMSRLMTCRCATNIIYRCTLLFLNAPERNRIILITNACLCKLLV